MADSTWYADQQCVMDGVDPNTHYTSGSDTGFFYAGVVKSFQRRTLLGFDLSAPPASGRALGPGDTIVSARLLLFVTVVVGPTGWGAAAARIARGDWDGATATWNNYKTGSAWTVAGGDVATPPAEVAFASPASLGTFAIGGMEEFAADALANRSGRLSVRLKADVEADAGRVSRYFSGGNLGPAGGPQFVVTYVSSGPAPIARSDAHAVRGERPHRAARPEAGVRPATPTRPPRASRC